MTRVQFPVAEFILLASARSVFELFFCHPRTKVACTVSHPSQLHRRFRREFASSVHPPPRCLKQAKKPTTGIEPATFCLRSRRSTAKLHWPPAQRSAHDPNSSVQMRFRAKYSVPGLNWGPLACEASVITTRPTEPAAPSRVLNLSMTK